MLRVTSRCERPAVTRGKRDTVRGREQLAASARRTAEPSDAADTPGAAARWGLGSAAGVRASPLGWW